MKDVRRGKDEKWGKGEKRGQMRRRGGSALKLVSLYADQRRKE